MERFRKKAAVRSTQVENTIDYKMAFQSIAVRSSFRSSTLLRGGSRSYTAASIANHGSTTLGSSFVSSAVFSRIPNQWNSQTLSSSDYLKSNNSNKNFRCMSSSAKDAGDVIGIDLGTTNSCVAIMVSKFSFA